MVSCGLFGKRNSSSNWNRNVTKASSVKTVRDLRKKYSSDLKAYVSACQEDPNLKSFDSELHEQAKKITRSVDDQTKTQSVSKSSLIEVYGFLLKVSQDAVEVIIESEEDVRKNKDLRSLVKVYLKSTAKTLDFCNIVDKCVQKTEHSKLFIDYAAKQFEAESEDTEVGAKKKYAKTLDELNKYVAAGDPFDEEFIAQYASVYDEQVLLLKELHKQRVKLDKKIKNVEIWRKVSKVVFMTAYVSVLVLSVVAAAMTVPPVVSAVAAVLTAPIEFAGDWCDKMLEKYEEALEKQKEMVSSVEIGAMVNEAALVNIRVDVDKLKALISQIQDTVKFAVDREGEEEAVRLVMQAINDQVDSFTKKIKEVGETVATSRGHITSGRKQVLDHILKDNGCFKTLISS